MGSGIQYVGEWTMDAEPEPVWWDEAKAAAIEFDKLGAKFVATAANLVAKTPGKHMMTKGHFVVYLDMDGDNEYDNENDESLIEGGGPAGLQPTDEFNMGGGTCDINPADTDKVRYCIEICTIADPDGDGVPNPFVAKGKVGIQ